MGDSPITTNNPNLASIAAGQTKTSNTPFFASSLVSKALAINPSVFRLHLSTVEAATIQYTVDDKATWVGLNSGQALVAGAGIVLLIPIKVGGKFNLRCTDAAGCTINICEVDEVWE